MFAFIVLNGSKKRKEQIQKKTKLMIKKRVKLDWVFLLSSFRSAEYLRLSKDWELSIIGVEKNE